MTRLLTRAELDRLLIDALTHARNAEPGGEDPDYGTHFRTGNTAPEEYGVKRGRP